MKTIRLALLIGLFSVDLVASLPAPTAQPFHVKNYLIRMQIDPSRNPGTFEAETEIRYQSVAPFEKFTLNIEQLNIAKVLMVKPDQRPLKFKVSEDKKTLEITLPGIMRKGETWTILVHYTGKINDSHEGLFKVTDPDDRSRGPLLFTQFESQSARSFFPCNDRPDDKATTEVEITVPLKYQVISNGKMVGDKKEKRGSAVWHEVHWKMERPHSTYLVSLAIGPFAELSSTAGGVPVSVAVGANQKDKAKYALETTQSALAFFESYLGVKYPWPKYTIVGVPTFLWGGMENTSSTHQNQNRTLLHDPNSESEKGQIVGLAAHELAHQWFGDYVTMAWWDDVWLNEAFASFMGDEAFKSIFKSDEAEISTVVGAWENYFRQEDGPRSHAIVDKTVSSDAGFDSINYTKGEQVLRMLRFWIGDPTFRKGMQAYLTTYAYRNATYLDFFAVMEKASGKSMAAFRDSWLTHRGYPVLTYGGEWNGGAKAYELSLEQHSNHTEDTNLFRFSVPVVFHRKSAPAYDKSVVVDMSLAKHTEKVSLPDEPEWVTVNPGGVALVKLKPTKRDDSQLTLQALSDPDTIARVWASFELARGLREGESISAEAQKTLAQVLTDDPSPYVRLQVLGLAQKMKARWLPSRLGDTVFSLAKAGQDPQFEKTPFYIANPRGARLWRSELLASLGRVDNGDVLVFLTNILAKKDIALDDLAKASFAVAALGDDKSIALLKETLKRQSGRGYAYQYAVQSAFGACENPKAAGEIAEIAKTCGSDFLGRIGSTIRDNQVLKNSREWASFVQDFVLHDSRFGDEVKARLLETIEEVKSDSVKTVLETIQKESKSPRMQEDSKKILGKNFSNS